MPRVNDSLPQVTVSINHPPVNNSPIRLCAFTHCQARIINLLLVDILIPARLLRSIRRRECHLQHVIEAWLIAQQREGNRRSWLA